jgi:hypothetical protein
MFDVRDHIELFLKFFKHVGFAIILLYRDRNRGTEKLNRLPKTVQFLRM